MSEPVYNASRTKILVQKTIPEIPPFQSTQLLLQDLVNKTTKTLYEGEGVVTHVGFQPDETPFFLVDTDPLFCCEGIDLYKVSLGTPKNLAFFEGKIFLIGCREGVDLLIEYRDTSIIPHATPFSTILSIEVRGADLELTGLLPTNVAHTWIFKTSFPDFSVPIKIESLKHPTLKGWQIGPLLPHRRILIRLHGGPIGMSERLLTQEAFFYYKKGYTLIYLNYSGSTGYGRKHRLALLNNYGVLEVEETVQLIDWLHTQGIASKDLFLKGKSSAGLSVLLTATQRKVCALSVYCPVTEHIPNDPELSCLFPKNFPIFQKLHSLDTPLILFQGDQDTCIPLKSTNHFVEHFVSQTSIEYHVLPGIGHQIRDAIEISCMDHEHRFFDRINLKR